MAKSNKKSDEIKQLEEKLKRARKQEREERNKKRAQYENLRDTTSETLVTEAKHLHTQLAEFKEKAQKLAAEFRDQMLEHGSIRGGENNKGSYEFTHSSEMFKIQVKSQVQKGFDERAELAEKHLRNFIEDFVKKRDKEMYTLIVGILERNQKTGKLDVSNINRLYKIEDKFDHPEWVAALAMFKEAYHEQKTTSYIQFLQKDEHGKWQPVVLNLSSI